MTLAPPPGPRLLSVYVAGAYAERDRAAGCMTDILMHPTPRWPHETGLALAHNWIEVIDRVRRDGGQQDADLDDAEALKHAMVDICAVTACDIFWLLAPEASSKGAWFELGWAAALASAAKGRTADLHPEIQASFPPKPRSIVSGPAARSTVFTRVADAIFTRDEYAFQRIVKYTKERP